MQVHKIEYLIESNRKVGSTDARISNTRVSRTIGEIRS